MLFTYSTSKEILTMQRIFASTKHFNINTLVGSCMGLHDGKLK